MGTEFIVGMIISTAVSVGTSVALSAQANSQQKALAEYQNRQRELAYAKSMAFNRATAEVKAQEQKRMLQARYDLMRGASEAQGAERGVLESRVQDAVLNSLGYAAARESAKITTEQELGILGQGINSQPQWMMAGSENLFLNGVQGGIQGFMNGLNIAQAANNLNTANAMYGIGSSGVPIGSSGVVMPSGPSVPNFAGVRT